MSYNLHVVSTEDFMRLDPGGNLDVNESRRVLEDLARQCVENGVNCMGFRTNHRLAILHRYREGQRAEFFAMVAKDDGFNVEAFERYEDAMDWFAKTHRVA
jgi:hypothetical protein